MKIPPRQTRLKPRAASAYFFLKKKLTPEVHSTPLHTMFRRLKPGQLVFPVRTQTDKYVGPTCKVSEGSVVGGRRASFA